MRHLCKRIACRRTLVAEQPVSVRGKTSESPQSPVTDEKHVCADDSGLESQPLSFWNVKLIELLGSAAKGVKATVKVPVGYGKTGAVKIKDQKAGHHFWLLKVVVTDSANDQVATALAETWIYAASGWRTIFVNKVGGAGTWLLQPLQLRPAHR